MACLLKLPTEHSKGVVTFTTQERDRLILKDTALQKQIEDLKEKWVVGLHHNWHDFNFHYNPLFDFSMAGEEDLRETNGTPFPLVPLDACDFVPEYFKPSPGEKFWDILYVARATNFKKIPEFLQCVRNLYDSGKRYRILFLCPIPPYKRSDRKTVFYDVGKAYESMFTEEEKNYFNLVPLTLHYPFPFDLETLAFFYRSSKIFVHFANNERRCRVAAYAWANGMPVVARESVGSLLPAELRTHPYFYEAKDYSEFEELIPKALNEYKEASSAGGAARYFDRDAMRDRLHTELQKVFRQKNLSYDSIGLFSQELDIRLGRHVLGGKSLNSINMTLGEFISCLQDPALSEHLPADTRDPERAIEAYWRSVGKATPARTFWERFFSTHP